jgi:hypothetical protein
LTATASSRSIARLALLGALAAAGCSSPGGGGEGPADASIDEGGGGCLTCASDVSIDAPLPVRVKEEIDQVCGSPDGCHGGGAPMGLHAGAEFDAMIGVTSIEMPSLKRVLPGDPEHSYVYLKLACDAGPIIDSCMPLTVAGGDPRIARLFHDWIEAGAPTP